MKDSFTEYLTYLESDQEFSLNLRIHLSWNDNEYTRLKALVLQIIEDYKETDLLPIPVVLFFTTGIQSILDIISRPDFVHNCPPDYQLMVFDRRNDLLDLRQRFFSGELMMKNGNPD